MQSKIRWYIEPEALNFELEPDASVEILITSGVAFAIDLQIEEEDSGPYIRIWPENGDYEIIGLQER
jgi:hypothetical protein